VGSLGCNKIRAAPLSKRLGVRPMAVCHMSMRRGQGKVSMKHYFAQNEVRQYAHLKN
jgi:hypothetical protein